MEEKIYEILNELGVPFNLLGRHYLVKAVVLIKECGHASMTKVIYPQVAKEFNTSGSRVERLFATRLNAFSTIITMKQ